MGAQTFMTTQSGDSPEDAFRTAVEQAQYMHGHGGYSGTIAEKTSFTVIPDSEVGDADPREYAQELLQTDDRVHSKWGPAGCIALDDGEYLFFGWASS